MPSGVGGSDRLREELRPPVLARIRKDHARDVLEAPSFGNCVERFERRDPMPEREIDRPPERFPVERCERVVRAVGVGMRIHERSR